MGWKMITTNIARSDVAVNVIDTNFVHPPPWNRLRKSGGVPGNYDAYAFGTIPITGDYIIDVKALNIDSPNKYVIGVSALDDAVDNFDIEYSVLRVDDTFGVFESTVSRHLVPDTLAIGDYQRIERVGTVVKYYHIPISTGIPILKFTSALVSSDTVYPDCSINQIANEILQSRISIDGGVTWNPIVWGGLVNLTDDGTITEF